MPELTLGGVGIEQASNPKDDEFQRKAEAAVEPIISKMTVGDSVEVFAPYYRKCKVLEVADSSVIVQATVQVDKNAPRHKWKEVWAERVIPVPYIKIEKTLWVDERHVIVVQEDRSLALRVSSPLIADDPKTGTPFTEDGKPFREYVSIVKVVMEYKGDSVGEEKDKTKHAKGS